MTDQKRATRRHRLLVYYRLGQRWRTMPLLTAVLAGLLYGLAWLANRAILQTGNTGLNLLLWERRTWLLLLISLSLLLYVFLLVIARTSFVEVRTQTLHVRAGLLPVDISYGRVRQIRLVQLGSQYPPDTLKGGEYGVLSPLLDKSCTAVDLRSWPRQPLKRLWPRFMFTHDGNSLLFVVDDAMLLNQQIDGAIAARQARLKKQSGYKDPIERAAAMSRKR